MPEMSRWEELYGAVGAALVQRFEGNATMELLYRAGEGAPAADAHDVWSVKGSGAPGSASAAARVAALDQMGVAAQVVFPDPVAWLALLEPGPRAAASRRHHNEWLGRFAADTADRAQCAAVVDPSDLGRLLAEVDHALGAGLRGVVVPHAVPPGGVAPGDPAADPLWSRLAEAGAVLYLHLGGESGFLRGARWGGVHGLEVGLDDFGAEAGEPMNPLMYASVAMAASLYLSSMVLGGVFARHPDLRMGIIEVGSSWVGPLLDKLDETADLFGHALHGVLVDRPSAYVRRQVRVTPYRWEPVGMLMARHDLGDVLCFSTDYPHREGGTDPFGDFARSLADEPPDAWQRFIHGNASPLLGSGEPT